jgi:D-glycero-alpha-D-manno-heptose 1-phosphate guanylyltransferase
VEDLSNMTALILAGGLGLRLRSAVGDRPKVLAQVHGRPFLACLLERLAAAAVREVVLCTGYQGDLVKAAFGDSFAGLHLHYSQESSPLGTAGALRQALPLAKSDPLLVMNGDSYCDTSLVALRTCHDARAAEGTLAVVQVPDTSRYGRVHIAPDGQVLRFDEKGGAGEPGWINAGIYVLSQRLVQAISPSGPASLERDVFPAWIGRGLYGQAGQGRFLDIGTPESYAAAEACLAGAGEGSP